MAATKGRRRGEATFRPWLCMSVSGCRTSRPRLPRPHRPSVALLRRRSTVGSVARRRLPIGMPRSPSASRGCTRARRPRYRWKRSSAPFAKNSISEAAWRSGSFPKRAATREVIRRNSRHACLTRSRERLHGCRQRPGSLPPRRQESALRRGHVARYAQRHGSLRSRARRLSMIRRGTAQRRYRHGPGCWTADRPDGRGHVSTWRGVDVGIEITLHQQQHRGVAACLQRDACAAEAHRQRCGGALMAVSSAIPFLALGLGAYYGSNAGRAGYGGAAGCNTDTR